MQFGITLILTKGLYAWFWFHHKFSYEIDLEQDTFGLYHVIVFDGMQT